MKRFLLILLSFTMLSCHVSCSKGNESKLDIEILEVGKADCILISFKGNTVVIDTGEEENASEILSKLDQRKVKKIHTLILSHFDKDHIGSAAKILERYEVESIIESTFSSDRAEYDQYHKAIDPSKTELFQLKKDYSFTIQECEFKILPPKAKQYDRKEDNNASLIVEIHYGDFHFAFLGDAMEERIEEYKSDIHAPFDFLKLPYHGNYLQNLDSLLELTKPRYTAICDSVKNPSDDKTIELLEEKGIEHYETKNGTIRIRSDGKTIQISQ